MRTELTMTDTALKQLCKQFRINLIEILYAVQTGHPGSSLSVCEILATLYYKEMSIDPQNPQWEERDRLVLSKGHASPMLYIILAELGFFPKEELTTLRQIDHLLQGHPSASRIPGVDASGGPLGLGMPFAVGLAAGAKVKQQDWYTYAIIGDGEMQEGAVWEAMLSAAKFKLDNLIVIVDRNKVQLDGTTDEIMPMGDIAAKCRAFGMHVLTADGHEPASLSAAIAAAKAHKEQPTIIIAETVKGKGISFMEGESYWHGAIIDPTSYKNAMQELGGTAQ